MRVAPDPRRGGAPPLSREVAEKTLEVLHECMEEGLPLEGNQGGTGRKGAIGEAGARLGISHSSLKNRLRSMKEIHGLVPDPTRYKPKTKPAPFTFDELPDDGELSAAETIEHLKRKYREREARENAKRLFQIRVAMDGPIGLALIGDPHVDNPGTNWVALERDVSLCRDTPGVMAVNLGDSSDNWVGRLMGLYAHSEVTASQSMKLIEWLFTQLPWLVTVAGNHDLWHTDTADPLAIMHKLRQLPGLYEAHGARLQLNFPSGASAVAHIRHDFPGRSQFNPAHALVRETLFGFRDHILACGHRHQSGHISIWHNDPERLCHGFRVGSYKIFDDYAKEKGFKPENWAPAMMAVIDPEYADDPVRYIRPCYSLEEGCEYLSWRRAKWETARKVA